jgi:aspartate/methionine/tyrosine aminotransferase
VLDLTQAVPGYPPHPELLARLGRAAADPACASYGPIQGDMALREALALDASGVYGYAITAGQVAITAGCNLAFAMAVKVIAAPGDEVLLPVPWYFNHEMALRMAGVRPLPLPGLMPDAAAAEALISPRTRAILLVSPNNPTGAVYPPALLRGMAELCRRRGLWLVLDETYRDFLDAVPHGLFESHADVLVHLYSFSKAYCLPGHRLGAVIAGVEFQAQLAKALDTLQICPARPVQAALAWAIPALREWRARNRATMAGRAAACRAALAGHRVDALGAYFAWLRLPDDAPDALTAAEHLAAECGLLVLPGPFFGPGQERYLRLAFANAEASRLVELPDRLVFSRA